MHGANLRLVSVLASALLLFAIGCASENASAPNSEATPPATQAGAAEEDFAGVVSPDRTFTIDQLETAGWKKSKQFPTDTLPAASDAWYGFYDRKDIEVRVYGSHADANGPGVAAAREAIGRSPNSNIGGGIITSAGNRTQYHAYVVAGNLVLLCEQTTETCIRLIQQIR